jgi:hypothetical protein
MAFTPDGVETQRYWSPERDPSVARLSFDELVGHCLEVCVGACRDLFAGFPTVWADLTGGYDTRLLTLLMREAGVSFDTETRGSPNSPDHPIAREIARRAGWNWSLMALPDEWESLLPPLLPVALVGGWKHRRRRPARALGAQVAEPGTSQFGHRRRW